MQEKKSTDLSRRSFLKISAGAAALNCLSLPAEAATGTETQLSTIIDLNLCDGCTGRKIPACVDACRTINKNRIPPVVANIPEPWPRKTIEDWSKKKDVTDRLTPYNFIYVHKAEIDMAGGPKTIFVPRRCMHCDNPACATICPFSANSKKKNGAVVIDQNLCFGGAKCKDVCPWEIPQRQSGVGIYLKVLPGFMGNGVMYKCDLCNERLKEGNLPGCVEACPREALLIGRRSDMEKIAGERARAQNGCIYGKKENGGTSTLYISPVPFELLNKTMEKKPGQPAMQPDVVRRMAGTDPLGKAVLAAPLLGLAAAGFAYACNRFFRRREQVKKEEGND
ncbi:MAG: Tetrathionate reductase subunit B precursor [Smithella sp. PtaU1.Bin162]|nr:MAG: Tetrathionate reductase subunit B precursor [Smithella sp. PtaU1.Bin162]